MGMRFVQYGNKVAKLKQCLRLGNEVYGLRMKPMALPFFFLCLQPLPHPEVWRRGGQGVGVTLVPWSQREKAPQQEAWGYPEHLCLEVEES